MNHSLEHLQQAPTLSRVTLGGKNPFTFEIHVIDQGVTTHRRAGDPIELLADPRLVTGTAFRQHFWERVPQPVHQELGLKIDRACKERAQLFHRHALCRLVKLSA